jgi:hypothetical protein
MFFFRRSLVVALSSVAGVALFEALAALLLPGQVAVVRNSAIGDGRVMYFSANALANRPGYYNFTPNMTHREVAYYPDSSGKMTVEYDCRYSADDLGFVSNAVAYVDSEVLLLGDSFAQGQGGCPWMPKLPASVRRSLYSAAVFGTSFESWQSIVDHLSAIKPPARLLIVFVTDDFFRKGGPQASQQIDCLQPGGDCSGQYTQRIVDDMPTHAAMVLDQRKSPSMFENPRRFLAAMFPASVGVIRTIKRTPERLLEGQLKALEGLFRRAETRLVWVELPEELKSDDARRHAVKDGLEKLGLSYTHCSLPEDRLLPRDRHPNAKGYDVLMRCVLTAMEGWY